MWSPQWICGRAIATAVVRPFLIWPGNRVLNSLSTQFQGATRVSVSRRCSALCYHSLYLLLATSWNNLEQLGLTKMEQLPQETSKTSDSGRRGHHLHVSRYLFFWGGSVPRPGIPWVVKRVTLRSWRVSVLFVADHLDGSCVWTEEITGFIFLPWRRG